MRRPLSLVLLLLAAGACSATATTTTSTTAVGVGMATPAAAHGADGSDADRREVVAAVERLFEGMRARDTAALRALFATGLVMTAAFVDSSGRWDHGTQTVDEFIRSVAGAPAGELRERMWDPEVRMDGALATVWAPYDFHIGTRFSHCGTDAVQLARGARGWVITGLSFTVRPQRCAPPG